LSTRRIVLVQDLRHYLQLDGLAGCLARSSIHRSSSA